MGRAQRFEAFFGEVAVRMAGLPVCNPALAVELRGWQAPAPGVELGVLIAPWCMSLLWCVDGADWPAKGAPVTLALASGEYEGIAHDEPALGRYASASLCSPMDAFADQAGARAMADEVLRLLLAAPASADETGTALSRRGLLRRVLGHEAPA